MFFGRKEEFKEISNAFSTNRFESILIYGRRRVGKTALIDEAMKHRDKLAIRYECKRTTPNQNLILLSKTVLESFDELFTDYVFDNYDALFDYVFKKSCEKEFVFIIDEFSFRLESKEAIDSALAVAIDKYKNDTKMKLVISGSYVMLLKQMIAANAHLYDNYSNENKVMMYSVFGGIPEHEISAERLQRALNTCEEISKEIIHLTMTPGKRSYMNIYGKESPKVLDETEEAVEDFKKIQRAYGVENKYINMKQELFNKHLKSIKYTITK